MKRFMLILCFFILPFILQATPDSLAVTDMSVEGVAYSLSAAEDDSNYVGNTGEMFMAIANASGGPVTVTVYSNVSQWNTLPEGAAESDQEITIADGTTKIIGPFNQRSWNDANGYVLIELSTTTSVTLAAYQFP
jgi:hypothetical protein